MPSSLYTGLNKLVAKVHVLPSNPNQHGTKLQPIGGSDNIYKKVVMCVYM